MSDSINSEAWWQSRINEIKNKGFNVENITMELERNESQASVILEKYEKQILIIDEIKNEIAKLPNNLELERGELLKKLHYAENADKVQNELNYLNSTFFPWRLAAKNNKVLWDSIGRGGTLDEIVRKLDGLDPSLNSHISELLPFFELPEKYAELMNSVNNIEVRQSERISTLNRMASLLSKKGFEAHGINEMSLEERFDALEELQKLDEKHMNLERRIKRTIGRFDSAAAANYNQQRQLLTKTGLGVEFEGLLIRIKNSEVNFLSRLEEINNKFSLWIQEGFKLDVHLPILADELLNREGEIEKITQDVEEYKLVWDRLINQYSIWPEEEVVTHIQYGILSEKNDIETIVIELERRSVLIEEEVRIKITQWKNKGFALEEIEQLNLANPRFAQNKIMGLIPLFEQVLEAKFLLNSLDLSFSDSDIKDEWDEKLINSIPDKKSLHELLEWISITEKRNLRHRNMLEDEWNKFQNKSTIDTTKLSLGEFEDIIKEFEIKNSLKENIPSSINNLKQRLMIEIEYWINGLKKEGWNVTELELMIKEEPNKLMSIKNNISKRVEEYEKLIDRLRNLPWGKNVSLAEKVLIQLKSPEMLSQIHSLIPQYMQILANSSEEFTEFDFIPWAPHKKITSLIEPKEIPQAELVIEDKRMEEVEILPVTKPSIIQEHVESKVINENKKAIYEKVKEIKPIKYQPNSEEWGHYMNSVQRILTEMGIVNNYDLKQSKNLESLSQLRKGLAKYVGIIPRDSRIDRLLRILLRVIPINLPDDVSLLSLSKIIDKLSLCVIKLSKWTTKRLERRHSKTSGIFLDDARELGRILEKIPSPGFSIPLISDSYDLPSINNIDELIRIVNSLEENILLSK